MKLSPERLERIRQEYGSLHYPMSDAAEAVQKLLAHVEALEVELELLAPLKDVIALAEKRGHADAIRTAAAIAAVWQYEEPKTEPLSSRIRREGSKP